MALTKAGEESLKTEANFIIGLATNLFATGVLAPVGTYIFAPDVSDATIIKVTIFAFVCFVACFALHFLAQYRLQLLD